MKMLGIPSDSATWVLTPSSVGELDVTCSTNDWGGFWPPYCAEWQDDTVTGIETTLTVLDMVKIPLGGSGSINKYKIGKIYVPTKFGGELALPGGNVQLYYGGGSDLSFGTACAIYRGEYEANRKTLTSSKYTVPTNAHGWYYVKTTSESDVSVSNTFEQMKTATKATFACDWYPMSDESSPNLYDAGGALAKYDAAYNTASLAREKRNQYVFDGHYLAKNMMKETDAECTVGYNFDGGGSGDPWDDWDSGYDYDLNGDSDTTDEFDVHWFGHCDKTTAVIISENGPSGNYQAPNNQVFTPELKKGLLVALYHGFSNTSFEGYDVSAKNGMLPLKGLYMLLA